MQGRHWKSNDGKEQTVCQPLPWHLDNTLSSLKVSKIAPMPAEGYWIRLAAANEKMTFKYAEGWSNEVTKTTVEEKSF